MKNQNKKRLYLGLFMFILLAGGGFCYHQVRQAVYTASLDTRALTVGVVEPISSLHPGLLSNHTQRLLASAIYEGLLSYDEDQQSLKPLLAKSWKFAPDGKSITLHLQKGVTFSNGKKLTAADVKASWEKNFSITKEWSNISMFLPIAGAKERLDGKTADIAGIKVVNDATLRVEFNSAHAAFPYVLTNAMFSVMDTAKGTELGAGTGPFTLKESSESGLILLRNENYHQGQARTTAIQVSKFESEADALTAYHNGKLDYLDAIPAQQIPVIAANQKIKDRFIQKPIMEVYWLGFNLNREPYTNNYLLRRALNYAIDRDAIIKNILGGAYEITRGVIPIGTTGYNKQMWGYHYDKEKAQKLLADAGYPGGKGLKPLYLTYNEHPGHQQIAVEVARQLGEIGIVVETQAEDWEYYKKQLNSMNVSFFRLGWEADYPDADNYLYSLFHSSKVGISNLTGYRNPQVDKILDASRAEYRSSEERIKLLQRAEQIIMDDAPCLFLFQKKACKLIGKDVRSLTLDCMGMINWREVELARPEVEATDQQNPTDKPTQTPKI